MSDIFAAELAAHPRQHYYGGILSQQVETVLGEGDYTPDEIAAILGKSVLSIRPRVSELVKIGIASATGERRRNASGIYARVYRLAPHSFAHSSNRSE